MAKENNIKLRIKRPISRALEPEKIVELAKQAGLEPPSGIISEAASSVEAAFVCMLELSEKDGSIVLSAGSMFVTAEVMMAWNKILSAQDGVESR